MGLEMYKLPIGLSEGVDIPLPDTDVVFRVKLPASHNEEFNMKLMSELNASSAIDISDDEDAKVDPSKFFAVRKDLFFKECILSAKGLPKGMKAAAFFDEYPLAATYVFKTASDLAVKADEKVGEAMEKLWPTPNGKSFGQVGTSNTKSSSEMALQ